MSVRLQLLLSLALVLLTFSVLAATNLQTIIQKGRAFSSSNLQISRGGVVRFSNLDTFVHQIYVESSSFNFESDEQPPGNNVDVAFSRSGTFEVRCHIHPRMLLHVDVR